MTWEIAAVLVIMLAGMVLFITEVFAIEVTALTILGILYVCGLLDTTEVFMGFSNTAVMTIAALFIISHSLQKTGMLEYLVVRLNKLASRSVILGLSVFLVSISLLSAFINNTAVVAIFLPIAIRLSQTYKISPSKVLIPLSYAAILGGTLTLVGTSTNLLVNSIVITRTSQAPLGMFEFARFGSVIFTVGILYILLVAYRLLPSRTVTSSLTKNYHLGGYLTEVKITGDSALRGKSCLERGINRNYDIVVLDILRQGRLITSNIRTTKLKVGDILFVRGPVESILRMKEVEKVTLLTDEKLTEQELTQADNVLVECLVTDRSDLVNRSVKDINFRRRFGTFVLAIRREGTILRRKIAHTVLKVFDTLLVYGPKEKIHEMSATGEFIVLEEIEQNIIKSRFWWLSFVVLFLVVGTAALSLVPIYKGALIGIIILLIFKNLPANEAYRAIHWPVIILIAALIPLGHAIQTSGTADWIGSNLTGMIRSLPEAIQGYVLLGMLYFITAFLTEVSSNAAAAIIMVPIALTSAGQIGLEPRPFIFAICYAASASFLTPVGYQTNLMVYGPGGYKFTDYIKIGFPIAALLWFLAILLIPQIWPFTAVTP